MNYQLIIQVLNVVLAVMATAHILLNKRQSRSAMLWILWVWTALLILWVWLVPWLGAFTYWYFGFNRVGVFSRHPPVRPGRTRGVRDRIRTLSDGIASTPWRTGNTARLMEDGDLAYPRMLDAIEGAKHSVALQTYIYDGDEVGESFTSALEDAARRGVDVRVLVDHMGSWGNRRALKNRLTAVGGDSRVYLRVDRLLRQPLFNLRNHRKLMVVDGHLAYTGGMNISKVHISGPLKTLARLQRRLRRQAPLRDAHFELTGPIVADLQAVFSADWVKSGGKALRGRAWEYRRQPHPGTAQGRVVLSGPDENMEKIYELLVSVLPQAKHSVDLCTPYFIPDGAMLMALRSLGHAGVRVRLLVPHLTDHPFMSWASREYFGELISAGVEVWEVKGSIIHTKIARIDDDWCFVGSANLDPRSFRLNFELNVELRSRSLAHEIDALLESYLLQSHRIDLPLITRRPLWKRLRGAAVNLMAPYL